MRLNNKFWLFAVVCMAFTASITAILAVIFWRQIDPAGQALLIWIFKKQFWYFFSTGVFLFAAFGFTLDWFFRFYIIPLNQLIEETRIMNTVNPAHRMNIDGSREIRVLSDLVNSLGDQYQSARHIIDQTVASARAETEAEKNILATIMAELTQGVLICDPEGRILLYNRQAKRVLSKVRSDESTNGSGESGQQSVPDGFIGLRRSIYSLIDEHLIQYALKEINQKIDQHSESVASHFVVVTHDRRQIGVETLPILDADKGFAGFALILSDITQQLERSGRMDRQFKAMDKNLRSAIAAIRSTVDLMIQFPEMETDRKNAFLGIIADETEVLSRLSRSGLGEGSYPRSRWPRSPIRATDFIATVKNEAAGITDLDVEVAECDARCMIRVDSYAMLLAIVFVLEHLKTECQAQCKRIRLTVPGNLVQLDLIWQGPPVKIETLRRWNELPVAAERKGYPLTLREVLAHNHAEIWPHAHRDKSGEACLRIFIPMIQSENPPEDVRKIPQLPKGRPEFYDFDLFHQAGQTPEIEKRLLGELVYTVFDTETTGLDPRGGDEIISIGAIRVVNGRLLHTETINQLVNPRRRVPPESIKFHGITDKMLQGKPTIEKVLPFFQRFVQNTVLVAHNAAFDMLMLQMNEKKTGIRFINPVLDTMHLSAILHPSHSDHTLDAISQRLGVTVTRRHDALGDAIATGEVFLKMIPLLNEKGIFTQKDARLASQRTYYAQLKY
ncbi:exonuclease domain-containing protein [Desulfosarcina ovata]|uniref:DNA polymerase III subunit epsilon n=1 Tax=Desulfosarcina ovata subsp. ovata TaxID=2752305 RepID=A0A5K8A4E5_9BACT|nr:exonuclease domain-containing protein [Desulfosarcina ovata]BBO87412.1 DNA polymerase III subunit epsilon [Desulfosarcina ovata subsp. ovata]